MKNQLPNIEAVRGEIFERTNPLVPCIGPALSNQLGIVLGEDIISDVDMPALPTSRMDGYALRLRDWLPGKILSIAGSTMAGDSPGKLPDTECCYQIATGAPLPIGADSVIPFENTISFHDSIKILPDIVANSSYIRLPGEEFRKGQILVKSGTSLGPVEYGLIALAGRTAIKQFEFPKIALISTGNEIVEPGIKPSAQQIRNSNGPMLMAQLCRAGAMPRFLGICPDKIEPMQSLIGEGATYDSMVLSGGASKGEFDLVKKALIYAGYEIFVFGVMMKPGKPFFCAKHPNGKLAFGLPGNPISAFVCFELFVRPSIKIMRGISQNQKLSKKIGLLAKELNWISDRPFVLPMKRNKSDNLNPCLITGSSDLAAISGADSLAILASSGELKSGDQIEYICLE